MGADLKRISGAGLRAVATVVSVFLVSLVLVGCTPKPAKFTPVPQVSATPVFVSDEEALAAAVEAYAKYLKVSDDILHGGGKDTSLASTVMTGDLLKSSLSSYENFANKGLRTLGSTTFDHFQLQQFNRNSSSNSIVVIYVCTDISGVQFLDSTGLLVSNSERLKRGLFEVTFDLASDGRTLLPAKSELWSQKGC